VIVGRGAAEGVVEYWDRRSGERIDMPLADVVDSLAR
jgi:prolyl-tRNA synthetase